MLCSKKLVLNAILTLILNIKFLNGYFESCDKSFQLNENQEIIIKSPNYPNKYPSGSSCKYLIIAPTDYQININCNLEMYRNGTSCPVEQFYFNSHGSNSFEGSEFFCGFGNFQRKSNSNKALISYVSHGRENENGLFSCTAEAVPEPCECGWSINLKIVGGIEATRNEFPSMAGIVHLNLNKVFCGGTIIHHRYVLSAAHCFVNFPKRNPINLGILVGANDVSNYEENPFAEIYKINEIFVHENFDVTTSKNDIALIKTVETIKWSASVGPACLPFNLRNQNLQQNISLLAAGWGTKSFGGEQSRKLLKTSLNMITTDECRKLVREEISNDQFCTYNFGRDACQFDSGGSLYFKGRRLYSVGIISYGLTCGLLPSVNTKVMSYLNWIKRKTQNTNFCVA